MRPPPALGLYWSIRGEVACETHAPDYDDRRWTIEGWAPMPESLLHRRGDGISVSIAQVTAAPSFTYTETTHYSEPSALAPSV